MDSRVRVLVYLTIDDADMESVLNAYRQISASMSCVDGLIRNELLRSPIDASGAVMSEWKSLRNFRSWEEGMSHRETTAALRGYQDGTRERVFEVFEVAAEHGSI